MKIDIPYGEELTSIEIDGDYDILLPKKIKVKDEETTILNALNNPIGRESFDEFIEKIKHLLVIVNDATRPTPTPKILEILSSKLLDHPDVKFIVATGSHKPPTEKGYRFIFGENYEVFKENIIVHDSRRNDMIYKGISSRGTKILVNPILYEYKNIFIIGSVEPHYFAGYTGGRKSFIPGVSAFKTIELNHSFALNREAKSLALKGNPVHEDMIEIADKIMEGLNVFSLQTVVTNDRKIYAATAGELHASFEKAVPYANEVFSVPFREKGDIVITVAPPPLDINLYQSQKALDNGKLALKENGILILVSKCRNGAGDDTFLKLLSKASKPDEVYEIIKKGYKLGYHKAAKIAEIATWADIWAVTSLNEDTVRKALMKPYKDIQKAVDDAINIIRKRGGKPRIIVLPQGSITVPRGGN
ncbi:MAG: nickel-dependent lactate racemase [Thermoplasmata archaeon]|nr:MAG: nickel-dependent lactate racemase [Thermoplasmata archaeon]